MLEINHISIEYKTKQEVVSVIKDLSLTIKEGEAVAILGPSGCGKSTLINALAGNVHIHMGTIEYEKEGKKQLLNSKMGDNFKERLLQEHLSYNQMYY